MKRTEMEDEHSALHSQWPWRPPPCLSTYTTPPPPPLLSSCRLSSCTLHISSSPLPSVPAGFTFPCLVICLLSQSPSIPLFSYHPHPPSFIHFSNLSHILSSTSYPSANFVSMVSKLSWSTIYQAWKVTLCNRVPSEPLLPCFFYSFWCIWWF